MKNIAIYSKRIILLFVVLILPFGSCNKLDEQPLGFAAPENFFNTVGQAEAVLAGSMDQLWQYWANEGYSWGWRLFEMDDQLADLNGDGGNLNIPYEHGKDLWIAHYSAILNLNNLLRAVNNGRIKNATPEEIDILVGQAKIMRGYNYFMLVRLFGDIPLYTEEMADPAINPIARTPVSEVYTLIINDFTEASAKLPLIWESGKEGRPTSGAAKGLLAKAYITMATAPLNITANYAKARDAAASAMADGIHSLVADINDVFLLSNKFSPEMMWSFNSNYEDVACEAQIWSPNELGGGWYNMAAEPRFDTLWSDQPRKNAYLLTEIDGLKYNEWNSQMPTCRKWLPPHIPMSDLDNYTNVVNCPIIRYADVLLLFAEAENMTNEGPTQAACDAINQVVDRANGNSTGLPGHPRFTTSMTKQQFDDGVIQERSWELCFEYDRWFDICRKRILDKVTDKRYMQNYSADDYLWPLPENDLRLNRLLIQNPGYPTP